MTLKDLKNGAKLPTPIYVSKPYVLLAPKNKENAGMVLAADISYRLKKLSSYFDDCEVNIRKYDLYLNDNTKISLE
jgi:hypothetical protein